jgi:hypothetical protein
MSKTDGAKLPLTLSVGDPSFVYDADGNIFAMGFGHNEQANAVLIVRAVNSHDALVEALEAVLLFHDGAEWDSEKRCAWYNRTQSVEATTKALCDTARAAIKAARGEE